MDQSTKGDDFSGSVVNINIPMRKTNNAAGEISNKCNQCDFTSSEAGGLKRHVFTHGGEKVNKCSQCDYASSYFVSWEVCLFFHET